MKVSELNVKQMIELKQMYMAELVDEGTFAEVMDVDYDEPSYGDLANADMLVPDEVIEEHYAEIDFTEDDFFFN